MKNKILISALVIIGVLIIFVTSCKKENTSDNNTTHHTIVPIPGPDVTDIDGNVYHSVILGTQTWMAADLKTTRYRNGDTIPNVTDSAIWKHLTTGAYCNYNNDSSYLTTYGHLYNGFTVIDNRNIAPVGWHLPTSAEWLTLEKFLWYNGYNYDGSSGSNNFAKSLAAETNWKASLVKGAVGNSDYPEMKNVSGFSALPAGICNVDGKFYFIGEYVYWWSSTECDSLNIICRSIGYCYSYVFSCPYDKTYGYSIRCIKD